MDFCLDIENISILNIFLVLKKEMATHSGILAWTIPWTEEPVGLWGRTELDMTEAT